MEHPAASKIKKALEEQAKMLAMLQASCAQYQDPRTLSGHPWCDLASINQVNKLIAEALGFIHGCEGSKILEEAA